MKKSLLLSIIILGIVAVTWRAALLGIGIRTIPAFDDECKVALQAMQIARGDLPLTILASPYIFPLDAYLMAPIINFLPRTAFGARIMAFGFGLITVFLSLLILRRWGSWKETWPGIALVLFPSAYMLMLQVGCALPGYPTLMMLGALVVWLAQRHAEATQRLWLYALLAGLAGGLAASDTLLSLPILVMAGTMIAVARSWRTALISAPAYGLGALIGFLPHLIATHSDSNAFQSVEQSVPLRAALKKILSPMFDRVLPVAFGWGPTIIPDNKERIAWPVGLDMYFGIAILLLIIGFTVISAWDFVRRWREERWPRIDTSLVFLGISWMCLGLFVFSARSHSHTYRYLIPLVWSFPFLLCYAYRRAGTAGRTFLGIVAALLLATNLVASCGLMKRWADPAFTHYLKSYDLKPVFEYLDKRGINRCYGTYADAYRITYESDERIICSQPYNERFPGWKVPFKEIVDAATNAAYVLSDTYRFPPGNFAKDLAAMKVTYRRETCGHYEVFTDFVPPLPPLGKSMPVGSFDVTTSHHKETALALSDGDLASRWRSHKNQEKGMWIEIRLRQQLNLSDLRLFYNRCKMERARAMRLLAGQGTNWVIVADQIPRLLDYFEFKNNHPVYGDDAQTIHFGPVMTDRLRLEILEADTNREWSATEIRLFTAE